MDLGERELPCDEVDDGDHLGLGAVATSPAFGRLGERVCSLEQPVAEPALLPGNDAVPVGLDRGDELLDRLQP